MKIRTEPGVVIFPDGVRLTPEQARDYARMILKAAWRATWEKPKEKSNGTS